MLSILKSFPKFGINAIQAVSFNYLACVLAGSTLMDSTPFSPATLRAQWLPWAVVQGFLLISLFNLMAYTAKRNGMTATAIAARLSLVIPVCLSVVLYSEHLSVWHIVGIIIAIPAIYLSSVNKKTDKVAGSLLPIIVLFAGSGLLDTLVNYTQFTFLRTHQEMAGYTVISFAIAGLLGMTHLTVLFATGKQQFQVKNLLAGICLGVPNFFSIYFLVLTLNSGMLQSSATIPLLNITVVVASTIWAIFFFKEPTSRLKIMGIALAVVAIMLIWLGGSQHA